MAKPLGHKRLNRIAAVRTEQLQQWKEGCSIERDSGLPLDDLLTVAAAARYKLALYHARRAARLYSGSQPQYRGAIGAYYYALYHALRACAFVHHQGDDHQEHSALPQYLPPDLPQGVSWATELKEARLIRNRADYEPYPSREADWKSDAFGLKQTLHVAMPLLRMYLKQKGCPL
jgi:hypothetical protein